MRRAINLLKPEFKVENYDLDLKKPQSDDQIYVAKKKTEQAFEIVKKPVFTQDCEYYIDKYNNFPGVFTKNVVLGLGKEGLAKIID